MARAFRVVFDNTDCPTNDDSMKPYVTRDETQHGITERCIREMERKTKSEAETDEIDMETA